MQLYFKDIKVMYALWDIDWWGPRNKTLPVDMPNGPFLPININMSNAICGRELKFFARRRNVYLIYVISRNEFSRKSDMQNYLS